MPHPSQITLAVVKVRGLNFAIQVPQIRTPGQVDWSSTNGNSRKHFEANRDLWQLLEFGGGDQDDEDEEELEGGAGGGGGISATAQGQLERAARLELQDKLLKDLIGKPVKGTTQIRTQKGKGRAKATTTGGESVEGR